MLNPTYRQAEQKSGQVAPGVHAIKSVYAANKPLWVYVLDGDFALWVDAGINVTPRDEVIPYLTQQAPRTWGKLQVAIITHADVDHFGGLRALKGRRPDTIVLAHEADPAWIESPGFVLEERYMMHQADGILLPPARCDALNERGGGGGKVDLSVCGGEMFRLGAAGNWRVLHSPGHSAGHIVLWDEERRWAIIGDAALDWGVPNDFGEVIAPPPYYVVEDYLNTIRMLQDLEAERVFTSHYGILDREQGRDLLVNSLAAVEALETAMTNALRGSRDGLAMLDLCNAVGARCANFAEPLWLGLADPLSAHLKQAIERGLVERTGSENGTRYRFR